MSDFKKNNLLGKFNKILFAPDIPALYGQGLSDYEILVRITECVNKCIDKINSFDELAKELEQALADIDGYVRDEVIKAVQEMYENGELSEIIGAVIRNSIQDRGGAIDLQHIGRVVRTAHNFKNYSTANHDNDWSTNRFNYAQGNVVFKQGINTYWAVAYVCNNGTVYRYNNEIDLVIYKFDSYGNLQYLTHQPYIGVGHANGLGYHDGYIYITSNSIQVYDEDTHTYKGKGIRKVHRIAFENEVLNSDYDTITLTAMPEILHTTVGGETIYNYVDGVCFNDDTMYVFDGFGDVYSVENFVAESCRLAYDNVLGDNTAPGGMQIDDFYIYFADYSSFKIMRYNRELGAIDWSYKLPEKSNCEMYRTGEIEGFTIIDNMLYILGAYDLQKVGNCYTMIRFFRQSLGTNKLPAALTHIYNWSSLYTTEYQTFKVAGDYPADDENPINPTGLTTDSAFTSVPEALDFIDACNYVERGRIVIEQAQHCVPIDIRTTKPVILDGGVKANPNLTGMIFAQLCPCLTIQNLGIRNMLPTTNAPNAILTRDCMYFEKSTVTLINPYFPVGTISNATNVKNAIKGDETFCNFVVAPDAAGYATPTEWETARGNNGVTSPKYYNLSYSTFNTHGHGDTSDSSIIK